jgi:hypothetical protein
MMRTSSVVVGLLAAAMLGGCQTVNDLVGPGAPPAAPTVTSEAPPAPAPSTAPVAPQTSLSGMSADRLRALWGEPTLKRTEPGAELWQYSGGGGCTLLVFVYAGSITRAEAVPGGADEATVAACARAAGKPALAPVS